MLAKIYVPLHGYKIYTFKQPLEDLQILKTGEKFSANLQNPGVGLEADPKVASASLSNPPLYATLARQNPRAQAPCAPGIYLF